MNNKYDEMYFHGLAGNIIVINSDELVINTALEQLENIILTGGIYSRNKLKEFNIEYSHKPVENGNDYISVCVKNPDEIEFTGYNEWLESSYVSYIKRNKIALIIDKSIEKTHTFRNPEESHMLPGERQIKDGISTNYIVGISVMFDNEESMKLASSRIKELLQKYNINIPILDNNLEQIDVENIVVR